MHVKERLKRVTGNKVVDTTFEVCGKGDDSYPEQSRVFFNQSEILILIDFCGKCVKESCLAL